MKPRPRVVVVGLGDTGLLTAVHLARSRGEIDLVAIGTKPALVSGQELGLRLARPERWVQDYRIDLTRYRRLDRVRRVHGAATALDRVRREVLVRTAAGTEVAEPYDVLVVGTGVSNGFWRSPAVQTEAEVAADLEAAHRQVAAAERIAVVGGGAAAVGSAYQLALRWPGKDVALYYPAERALLGHHDRVWADVSRRLSDLGVRLQPGHRAVVPPDADRITTGPIGFEDSHPPARADAVVWAIGRVRPHTDWLPRELLDPQGFVAVRPTLQTVADEAIFAIGDVAATDPLRSSARNRADRLLARNIRAHLAGDELADYRPAKRRWGSVLGYQPDGLRVYAPDGRPFRFPARAVDGVLRPWIIRRGIYKGIRPGG